MKIEWHRLNRLSLTLAKILQNLYIDAVEFRASGKGYKSQM